MFLDIYKLPVKSVYVMGIVNTISFDEYYKNE